MCLHDVRKYTSDTLWSLHVGLPLEGDQYTLAAAIEHVYRTEELEGVSCANCSGGMVREMGLRVQ